MTEEIEKELIKIMGKEDIYDKYFKNKEVTVDDLMKASGRNPDYDEVRGLRYNSDKLRYDLIPPLANRECAKVWTESLGKYPENNWEKGMPWTEVIASAMRHLEAIRMGDDIDSESGLLHAAHLQCNAQMLTEYYFTKQDFDNRKKYDK
jgi:hypothetical protein